MCGTCGCAEAVHPDAADERDGADERSGAGGSAAPVRPHRHGEGAEHGRPDAETRRVSVETAILAGNDARAAALRARLAARGIEAIGLLGGPGSGKTALLEATLRALGADAAREAVIEGDCATDHDARRIAACGARVVQIETGSLCHLDAHLVEHAVERLDLTGVARLWIENVGNLVCPAPFPCGETRRVALVSAPEGDDKPEKYPALFAAVDLLVITKADLLPHLDFDPARAVASARKVKPELPALVLSARSGEGLGEWLRWVEAGRA
jgi:hydrogenase nickel incorporation protein HypB